MAAWLANCLLYLCLYSYSVSSDVLSYTVQFDLLLFVHEHAVQFNTEDCHWGKLYKEEIL